MSDAMMSWSDQTGQGHLRVSDRERDDTIDLLAEAATDGRLTLEEYAERASKALTSLTRSDLAALTHDLAMTHGTVSTTASAVLPGGGERAERVVAVFGSEQRRGRWQLPARLTSRAVFGECKLDLQDANLHTRVTTIDARAVFGSIHIVVPHGVEVRMTGISVFGSRSCRVRDTPPGAPVVEVRGWAVFGEITVRHPGWREGVRKLIAEHLDPKRP